LAFKPVDENEYILFSGLRLIPETGINPGKLF